MMSTVECEDTPAEWPSIGGACSVDVGKENIPNNDLYSLGCWDLDVLTLKYYIA